MMTLKEITEKHPNWTYDNRERMSLDADQNQQTITEVLLKNPCVKCGKPIGEHHWVDLQFICPAQFDVCDLKCENCPMGVPGGCFANE